MSNNSHQEFSTTTWNDAQVVGDLNAPEVVEALQRPIPTLCGFNKKQESGTWRAWKPSLRVLIEKKLSLHETKRSKDGDAIVFASPVNEHNSEVLDTEDGSFALVGRRKNDIRSVSCAGVDCH
jgi:hypothetical protein